MIGVGGEGGPEEALGDALIVIFGAVAVAVEPLIQQPGEQRRRMGGGEP